MHTELDKASAVLAAVDLTVLESDGTLLVKMDTGLVVATFKKNLHGVWIAKDEHGTTFTFGPLLKCAVVTALRHIPC